MVPDSPRLRRLLPGQFSPRLIFSVCSLTPGWDSCNVGPSFVGRLKEQRPAQADPLTALNASALIGSFQQSAGEQKKVAYKIKLLLQQ